MPSEMIAKLFLLMALQFDVPTVARFDEFGIQLFSASIERLAMRLRATSLVLMRRGEAMDWLMSPIRTEVTCHGVVGLTDFVVALNMGARWKVQEYVRELYGMFPAGIQQGWDVTFMESMEELVKYALGTADEDADTPDAAINDCFLNLYPITEKKRYFPGNILGGETITNRERGKNNQSPLFHGNSGHSVFRQMFTTDTVELIEGYLNEAAEGLWNGAGRAIQPIIEKMGHYHATPKGRFKIPDPGTGPMGSMTVNNIDRMADILNGMGGQFPDEPLKEVIAS